MAKKKTKASDAPLEEVAAEVAVTAAPQDAEFTQIEFLTSWGNCYKTGDSDELPANKASTLIAAGIAKAL